MAESSLQKAFDDCLERIHVGKSLEDCLHLYPELADELRPMLEMIRLTRLAMPDRQEIDAARFRGMNRLRTALDQSFPGRRVSPLVQLVRLAAAVLIFGLFFGGGAWISAQRSLPGDRLYGLKRLTEDIRLDLSKNDSTLTEQFNQRRVDEIQELLSRGHEAEVEFSGIWQDQAGSNWMIAGLIVEITGDTQIEGTIKLLDRVKVRARTIADGRIVAIGIQPDSTKNDITPDEPLPTPTPSATSTATASSTSTPTAISSPTPTPTMTVTASLIPSPSATLCVAEEPDGWATYIVQPGDTLTQIAERAGITLNQLMDVNCLSDPNYLIAGWHLYAPAAPQDTSSFPTELSPGDDGHDDNGDDSPDVDSHD